MIEKGERVSYLGVNGLVGTVTDLFVATGHENAPELMAMVRWDGEEGARMNSVRYLRKTVKLCGRVFSLPHFHREDA